jgi:hypothetical protein
MKERECPTYLYKLLSLSQKYPENIPKVEDIPKVECWKSNKNVDISAGGTGTGQFTVPVPGLEKLHKNVTGE